MEARKITVMTTNNGVKTFMSEAETLGALKIEMQKNGIETEGMSFYEGVSKTTLNADESVLPTNVPYKGNVTNELVIALSRANKRISSGAMTRSDAYAAVKENNLQDAVTKEFGKNYTQVKTEELEKFLKANVKEVTTTRSAANPSQDVVEVPKKEVPAKTESKDAKKEEKTEAVANHSCGCNCNCKNVLSKLISALNTEEYIDDDVALALMEELDNTCDASVAATVVESQELESPYDSNELAEMLKFRK